MAYAYPKRGLEALNEEQLANYNNYIKMGYLNEPALGAAFNNISPEKYLGSVTAYGATNNTGLGTVTGSTNNENYGVNMDINDGASSIDVTNAINEYNRRMDEYNAQERAYREYVDNLAQKNWQNEFDFEKEKFRQQLRENELTRTREDSAYQRTMHDMALAGINPLMVGKFGLDPTSMGQVAGNAPSTPSFHGGTPSPIQSQAAVLAAENASKRQAETAREEHLLRAREIEIQQEEFDRKEKQFYDELDQVWEIAKKDRDLRKELSDAESETEKWIANANNMTHKEIANEQNKITQNFQKIQEKLQKRGQNMEMINGIIRSIVSIGATLIMLNQMKSGNYKPNLKGNIPVNPNQKWNTPNNETPRILGPDGRPYGNN